MAHIADAGGGDAANTLTSIAVRLGLQDKFSRLAGVKALVTHVQTVSKTSDSSSSTTAAAELLVFANKHADLLIECLRDDRAETLREQTVTCLQSLFSLAFSSSSSNTALDGALPLLFNALRQRMTAAATNQLDAGVERSEEVRLSAMRLTSLIVRHKSHAMKFYFNELGAILPQGLLDPMGDIRTEAYACIHTLARDDGGLPPEMFAKHADAFLDALIKTARHQHARVRAAHIVCIGDVISRGCWKRVEDVLNIIAQRSIDEHAAVRMAVVQVLTDWLLNFVDRYSYHARFIPLLLTACDDSIDSVRDAARAGWLRVGAKYADENHDDFREKANYDVMPQNYPQEERPSFGCRMLVQRNIMKILPGCYNDIRDWIGLIRARTARLFWQLLLHAEANGVTMELDKVITCLMRSARDEDKAVVENVRASARLLGHFVPPDRFFKLFSKQLKTTETLVILLGFLQGAQVGSDELMKHIGHGGFLLGRLYELACTSTRAQLYYVNQCAREIMRFAAAGEEGRQIDTDLAFKLFVIFVQLRASSDEFKLSEEVPELLASISENMQHLAQLIDGAATSESSCLDNEPGKPTIHEFFAERLYESLYSTLRSSPVTSEGESNISSNTTTWTEASPELSSFITFTFQAGVNVIVHQIKVFGDILDANLSLPAHIVKSTPTPTKVHEPETQLTLDEQVEKRLTVTADTPTEQPSTAGERLRFRLFKFLVQFFQDKRALPEQQAAFTEQFGDKLLANIVLPNTRWCVGRSSAILRMSAITTLLTLTTSNFLHADKLAQHSTELIPRLLALLDEREKETRAACITLLYVMLKDSTTLFGPLGADANNDVGNTKLLEILPQLTKAFMAGIDDDVQVRRAAVGGLTVMFQRLGANASNRSGSMRSWLEDIIKTVVLHLDDDEVHERVGSALLAASTVNRSVVEQALREMCDRARKRQRVQAILNTVRSMK